MLHSVIQQFPSCNQDLEKKLKGKKSKSLEGDNNNKTAGGEMKSKEEAEDERRKESEIERERERVLHSIPFSFRSLLQILILISFFLET